MRTLQKTIACYCRTDPQIVLMQAKSRCAPPFFAHSLRRRKLRAYKKTASMKTGGSDC
ncbi:hypothetical protein [Burkholderia mallei]|uniref:hypothetical protein n=1 Tax=Burkholderia mallei TaxID=13373 RepID=UPI00130D608D|nr:hypothetical protein [Burkholderia mallei]